MASRTQWTWVWVNSRSWWCHPTIVPCQFPSPPALGPFQMSQLFASGGQSIGVSASASVLLMGIQDWVPLGWTGLISLQSNELSKESSPTPQFKSINSSVLSFLYGPTLTSIHDYWKSHSFDYRVVSTNSYCLWVTGHSLVGDTYISRLITQINYQLQLYHLNQMIKVNVTNNWTSQYHMSPDTVHWDEKTSVLWYFSKLSNWNVTIRNIRQTQTEGYFTE